jgi:hypothetical protein
VSQEKSEVMTILGPTLPCKRRELGFFQQAIPLEQPEILPMLMPEGVLIKKRGGKLLEHLAEHFPICRAKVNAKRLPAGQEQLICYDVRESTHDVRVQFDLPEGRFHVVGMGDNVQMGGVCP